MKVAVLGPNADNEEMLWANYNGTPTECVSILEGIQSKLGTDNVVYESACNEYAEPRVFTNELPYCSYNGNAGFKATFWNNISLTGKPAVEKQMTGNMSFTTRTNKPVVPGVSVSDFSARFETTFTPKRTDDIILTISGDDGYKVYIDGKEIISDWRRAKKKNWEYAFHVTKGTPVQIKVDYYHEKKGTDFSIKLGYPSLLDHKAIANRVKDADVIVYVGGMSAKIEGEELTRISLPGFKGGDRSKIELPEVQQKMLMALKETGKPVILVLCSGSSLALPWEQKNLDGILAAWYPGQQGGNAVADVLFGDYNPGGRLPLTFYASTDDLPDFEDYDMTKGRTYRYFKGKPIYPFGYGLSYTSFKYGKGQLQKEKEGLALNVAVKNVGHCEGDEVVQVYIRNLQDKKGPLKSLRGFQRVHLEKGEEKQVNILLPESAFEFYCEEFGRCITRKGDYEILYGSSSDDKDLQCIKYTIK